MADFIKTQNSFANGEVAPEFYARDNIKGLSKLENMDVLAGGGISRRSGLRSVSTLPSDGRLISFSVSDSEEYLIVLTDCRMNIFLNDTLYQSLISPWSSQIVPSIQYAQRFGTMIFVHPDYPPQTLQKNSSGQVFLSACQRNYCKPLSISTYFSASASEVPFAK